MGAAARANFDCEIKMDGKDWLIILLLLYYYYVIIMLLLDDAQRYHCGYCGCDITLRLKCTICSDFDLCLHVC